ncbi:MAG: glycosyltransferase family 4 protein, partial [Desulfohalobiaceae bacterium]|nr:glycosyltransferase family 4 protein [Desulfohalobiaceae bacterium]
RLGLPTHEIPLKGRFDPRAVSGLVRLLKEHKINLVHTHGYKSDILGLVASRFSRVKSLATPHGFENAKSLKLQTFIRLGCWALKHFDSVAPLSEALFNDMLRIKVPHDKIRHIQNGVDLGEIERELHRQSPPFVTGNREKRIGYVGQLAFRKNLGAMIRAFDLLCQEQDNVRLILIGDGPQRSELEALANSLSCADKVDFLGYRNDRLRIVKELDLFCMTSSLEGIPRCMMEAMALGVPVAAFDIPGVDKLLLHGETGLMAKFGDVQGLKTCLAKILSEPDLTAALSKNGREHIEKHFSAQRMAWKYEELYEQMLYDA